MKIDSCSHDALGRVDLVVNAADVLTVASPMPPHKDRPAAGHAAAMVAFVAGLLVAALGAGADEPAPSYPVAGRGGTDGIPRQPTAQQSAPPNQLPDQLDVSANRAGTVDALYRLLTGPQPTIFSDSLSITPPSSSAER